MLHVWIGPVLVRKIVSSLRVAGGHQSIRHQRRIAFSHEIEIYRPGGCDHRFAEAHGLCRDKPESLGSMQGDNDIGHSDETHHLAVRHDAVDDENIGGTADALLDTAPVPIYGSRVEELEQENAVVGIAICLPKGLD